MKSLKIPLLCYSITALLLGTSPRLPGQSDTWDLDVLDQILAKVPPGSSTAEVGDMEIQVSNLRTWRAQLAGGPVTQGAFSGTAPLWTGGTVYYQFHASVSAPKQQAFRDAAREWEMFANVRFLLRSSQPNYILVEEDPTLSGGRATLGMVGGQQSYKIGPTSWDRVTLVHELGHTLGMVHEHQRSDRDAYVTILTANITPGAEGNFVKLGDSINFGAYDFLSIMHYARNAFSVSPATLNTIEPLPAYLEYLDRLGEGDPILTPLDRAGMANRYGAGPVLSSVVTNTLDGGLGSLRTALYYAYDHPGTTVSFSIPTSDPGYAAGVFTLQPTDQLPGLSRATLLDGSTQPGNTNPNGPEIQINGAAAQTASVFANGLRLWGTNCTVHGVVVNGFEGDGILIEGTNASGNTVSGCYVGLNASGSAAVPNGLRAINIAGGACGNTIGGTGPSARNVISGSSYQGVILHDPGTRDNQVLGNYLGLNAAGTAALPNSWAGVNIYDGASSNRIGGTVAGAANVISGNGHQGVLIQDAGSDGNRVQGNLIGVNPTGTAALANGWAGVEVSGGAQFTVIGGPGAGNVISGNSNQGVSINGSATRQTVVQGNLIGLNSAGTAAVPNGFSGIQVFGGANANHIGGTTAASGNVLSGNGNYGVSLSGSGVDGNVIEGNLIGLNAAGTAAVGNAFGGVGLFSAAQNNRVGGSAPGARNVISGNDGQGVILDGAGTMNNLVAGNFIGLNSAGTVAVPNDFSGIALLGGAQSNLIGGGPGARNFISGNGSQGIRIADAGTSGNRVQGNSIGWDAFHSNTVLNASICMYIHAGATANSIGGTSPGMANLMANLPGFDAIQLVDGGTLNNTIRGNSIAGTSGRAIGLYNGGQNNAPAPTLTSAVVTTNLTVSGTLSSTPSTTFTVDFYASPSPTLGQAKTWVGSANVTTSGAGSASFTLPLAAVVPAGHIITASATDPAGNTSSMAWGTAVALTSSVNDGHDHQCGLLRHLQPGPRPGQQLARVPIQHRTHEWEQ